MASTYTTNLGIEKIGTGEQSGTWGDTTNLNFDIIDQAINGLVAVTLPAVGSTGSPNTLPITDGTLSDGRNAFIELVDGGDLGGTAYVQLTPNDAEKIAYVRNSLSGGQSAILFQGTYNASNDFELANGKDALLFFNGGGSGAVVGVVQANEVRSGSFQIDNIVLDGNTIDVDGDLDVDVSDGDIVLKDDGTTFGGLSIGGTDTDNLVIKSGSTPTAALTLHEGNVGFGTQDEASFLIDAQSASAGIQARFISTDASASSGPDMKFYKNSASPADGDVISSFFFNANTDDGAGGVSLSDVNYGSMVFNAVETNETTGEVGGFALNLKRGGTTQQYISIVGGTTSDTDNDSIVFSTGGTPAITVDNNQNVTFDTNTLFVDAEDNRVGIGNVDPQTALDVTGTVTADGADLDGAVVINESGADVDFRVESDTKTYALFVEGSSGHVGIGTNSPAQELEVSGEGVVRTTITCTDNNSFGAGVFFRTLSSGTQVSNSTLRTDNAGNFSITTGTTSEAPRLLISSGGDISFYEDTGTTPKLFWDASAESLGIGTSSPATQLELSANNTAGTALNVLRFTDTDLSATGPQELGKIEFYSSDSSTPGAGVKASISGLAEVGNPGGGLTFSTDLLTGAPIERMRIDRNGNVGIGVISPTYKFEVSDGTRTGVINPNSTLDAIFMGTTVNKPLVLGANDTEKMRVYSGGDISFRDTANNETFFWDASAVSLGIGTDSPSNTLHVNGSALVEGNFQVSNSNLTTTLDGETGNSLLRIEGDGTLRIDFGTSADKDAGRIQYDTVGDSMRFSTDNTERVRIDSVGRTFIGNANNDTNPASTGGASNKGATFGGTSDPYLSIGRTGNAPLILGRIDGEADVILMYVDGSRSASMGNIVGDGSFYVVGNSTGIGFGTFNVFPMDGDLDLGADNSKDLGAAGIRWDDVYATNGTIQTSDRNEKQDIEELSEAEQRVAVAAKSLMRKFRWKSAVAKKDNNPESDETARIHFGIIAQDLQAAFEAEGLDAGRYAMFIHSEWWETYTDVPAVEAVEAQDAVYDEEGNLVSEAVEAVEAKEAYTRTDKYETEEEAPEGAVKKSRMGVRYSELLAFIIAAI